MNDHAIPKLVNGLSTKDWEVITEMLRFGATDWLSWHKPYGDERKALNALRGSHADYLDYARDTFLYVYGDNNHLAIPIEYGSTSTVKAWGRDTTMMVLRFRGPDGLMWSAKVWDGTGRCVARRLKNQRKNDMGPPIEGLFCWVHDYHRDDLGIETGAKSLSRWVRYGDS